MRGLDRDWSCWFSGLDRDAFLELTRRTIVGNHDPSEVILMDIDPPHQKTSPDFDATKLLFDVDAVDPRELFKRGRKLYRGNVQIKRIYNRVVFDELISKNIETPFDYREELDVEWAPHPNWYWVWSKYSLPFLDHPFIELMAQVPAEYKTTLWSKKVLFKEAFRELLPSNILHRKKLGFSVPLGLWLRTDLKHLMCELLSKKSLSDLGYLKPIEVERIMSEHLAGRMNHENKLWGLINLVLWQRQQGSRRGDWYQRSQRGASCFQV